MRYQIYEPDTLDFDFSGVIGSIGRGLLTIGRTALDPKNVQAVVSGIVSKQVAKMQRPAAGPAPAPSGFFAPPAPYSTQPVFIPGGGGAPVSVSVAPQTQAAPPVFGGIPPMYLLAGAGLLAALLITRR